MRNRTIAMLCLAPFWFLPVPSSAAAGADPLENHAVETATTPADHTALAGYYRAKAAEAQAEAARHESMRRAYSRGKLGTSIAPANCKRLSEQNHAIATEYEGLAKLHESEAKKGQ